MSVADLATNTSSAAATRNDLDLKTSTDVLKCLNILRSSEIELVWHISNNFVQFQDVDDIAQIVLIIDRYIIELKNEGKFDNYPGCDIRKLLFLTIPRVKILYSTKTKLSIFQALYNYLSEYENDVDNQFTHIFRRELVTQIFNATLGQKDSNDYPMIFDHISRIEDKTKLFDDVFNTFQAHLN